MALATDLAAGLKDLYEALVGFFHHLHQEVGSASIKWETVDEFVALHGNVYLAQDEMWAVHAEREKKKKDGAGEGATPVARKGDGEVAGGAEAAVSAASSSSGAPLPAHLQKEIAAKAGGADLSAVRVHTGAASDAATKAVGARAYAVGQDIHFAAGQYDPSSEEGQHLIAHEVAHTVQQRGGSPKRQNKLAVSGASDHAEVEADRFADSVTRGGPAASISGTSTMIARDALPGTNPAEATSGGTAITTHRPVGVGDAANAPAAAGPAPIANRPANLKIVATQAAPLHPGVTPTCPNPDLVFQEGAAVSPVPAGFTAVTSIAGTIDTPVVEQSADPGLFITNQPTPDDVRSRVGIGDCYFYGEPDLDRRPRPGGHIKTIMTPDGSGGASASSCGTRSRRRDSSRGSRAIPSSTRRSTSR